MNVLSLFDGISCGKVALEKAGIAVDKYYTSEVDKYAIQISEKNHPDLVRLGDVHNVKPSTLPKIDLLIGGSPCTGFSIAGKRMNFDDPQSKLFFEYVRLLKECKPKYFLLENVKMKKEWQDIITSYLGVEPIMINSALVSAQNRKRLYWTNIPCATQPEDKHIYLKDVLEYGYTEKDKAYCITATYGNACFRDYFYKNQRQLVFNKPVRLGHIGKSNAQANRVYHIGGKSVCLNANGGGAGAKTGLYLVGVYNRPRGNNKGGVRFNGEKSPALTSNSWEHNNHLLFGEEGEEYRKAYLRKLTPIECERLQTLPDGYTEGVSNTQRYKTIGNGWTVDVISHILKGINKGVDYGMEKNI